MRGNHKHGGKGTLLYTYWKDYRRRGLFCAAWRDDFVLFRDWATASGYREGHRLWRRDTEQLHGPENSYWNEGQQVRGALTHGGKKSRLYCIWKGMRKRCSNPRDSLYQWYGGRGISVCEAWSDFGVFREWALANGYADDLTIERKDVNGHYEPGNCLWITRAAQLRNTRRSRMLTAFGETKLMTDWIADPRCAVRQPVLHQRLANGWGVERAISTPPRPMRTKTHTAVANL